LRPRPSKEDVTKTIRGVMKDYARTMRKLA
jgi:hypothetical protein